MLTEKKQADLLAGSTVRGINAYRLDPAQDNPREVAFSRKWEELNLTRISVTEAIYKTPLLATLLKEEPSARDSQVAATIIQWLGSNIGMGFLMDVMRIEPKIREDLRLRRSTDPPGS